MKLAVLGASGGTGRHVVRQALSQGHSVTAVVRDRSRLPDDITDGTVDVVVAADASADNVAEVVRRSDAVINVIGTRDIRRPTDVVAVSTQALIDAANAGGARPRLVLASSSAGAPGPGDDPFTRYVVKPLILKPLLRQLDDMRQAEQIARGSGLPSVIVRAGRLSDRDANGHYRHRIDRNVPGGYQVRRTDFASALLDALTHDEWVGHIVSVSS